MFEPFGLKRLSDIVPGDETWFPFFIIPPKRLNRMWVDGQRDRPVVLRPGFQSRKRLFTDRLAGRNFDRIQDLAKAMNSELRTIPGEDYRGVFRKRQIRLKRCREIHGEYIEGL
ncbi:transposase [Elysia marginata]|uniref:Transposase n=1 Tax=Elysia marginata TaxID=1093978 RepID=A0AAV4FI79_9GAST|nr:transposase [Elysia marginata]